MTAGSRLRGRTLMILILMVGALIFASCSTVPQPPAISGTPGAETKPYGSLTIAGEFGTMAHLDPGREVGGQTFSGLGLAVFDTLLYRIEDGQIRLGLAERWEVAPDGKSYTFYIRKGVKFHDGSDLTGADVKFSIERMLAPESLIATVPAWRAVVTNVELKDDYTVVLHMNEPQYYPLRGIFGSMTAVMPKKYIEEKGADYFGKNPIGSGPWKVVKYDPGYRLELEAVESHWRAVPKFKNITVLDVREEGTRVAMIKTGELDIAKVSPDSAMALKSAGVRTISFPAAYQFLGFVYYDLDNPQRHAVGDVRVRKALTLAMDRGEMAEKLFVGYARPYVVYPMLPQAPFFDANRLKLDPYDPEGAKRLLAEAGYPNGFSTRIYDTIGADVTTLNHAIQGYWRRIGVIAELVAIDYGAHASLKLPLPAGNFKPEIWNSIWTFGAAGGVDFPDTVQRAFHSTKGFQRNTRNPTLDALIDKVMRTADPVERNRLAADALVMARDQYSNLALLDGDLILAVSPKVGEITPVVGSSYIAAIQYATITHAK